MVSATVTVICYKWKTLANGENPLMLRVTKDRKTKYQSLGISITKRYLGLRQEEILETYDCLSF